MVYTSGHDKNRLGSRQFASIFDAFARAAWQPDIGKPADDCRACEILAGALAQTGKPLYPKRHRFDGGFGSDFLNSRDERRGIYFDPRRGPEPRFL
jgi:hypothetical protein